MSTQQSTPSNPTDSATELTEDALTQVQGGGAGTVLGIWDFSKKATSFTAKHRNVAFGWKVEEGES